MSALAGLLRSDFKNLVRDPVLLMVSVAPLLIAVLLRFGLPEAREQLLATFDLSDHYAFAASSLLQFAPVLFGMVVGLMLLDERDQGVLSAIAVSQLGKAGFFAYRLGAPVAVSVAVAVAALVVFGLVSLRPLVVAPAVLLAALNAPILVLFLAGFADNKVEGLALGKFASIALLAPFAIPLVPEPWEWLAGVVPVYWVSKAFLASPGSLLPMLALGATVHCLYLFLLWRRFARRVEG